MPTPFADRLLQAVNARRTPAVVGIDPVYASLPSELKTENPTLARAADAVEQFCRAIIDIAATRVPAVKLNSAFFEAFYDRGVAAYYRLVAYAHARGLLVIGDIKRGDIGSTAKLYAQAHLEPPAFADVDPASIPDAVTLAGYLGESSVRPFIDSAAQFGRGVFVLVRPSDPGADAVHEFPGPEAAAPPLLGRLPRFYEHMAALVRRWGEGAGLRGASGLSSVGAVVAPKDSASTGALRQAMPFTPWLVPGYGAQGAGAESCRPCFFADGRGAVINASRSVIYAFADPAIAARHGTDWRGCVTEACDRFASDVAPLLKS
jgi:orotidine-5'-phosphate decarboxylase